MTREMAQCKHENRRSSDPRIYIIPDGHYKPYVIQALERGRQGEASYLTRLALQQALGSIKGPCLPIKGREQLRQTPNINPGPTLYAHICTHPHTHMSTHSMCPHTCEHTHKGEKWHKSKFSKKGK